MTDPREPIRLIASADADPLLRDALRAIHEDTPSVAALTALADNAERAVREGSGAANAGTQGAGAHVSAHSYPLMTKLVIAGAVAGALVYAGVQRARVDVRARPEGTAQTQATAVVPARDARAGSTGAVRAAEEAPLRMRSAADQASDTQGVIGAPAPHAPQPAVHRARRRAQGAQRSDVASAAERTQNAAPVRAGSGDSRAAKTPAIAAAPRRAAAEPQRQDAQDQGSATPPAASEIELLESAQHALQREPRRALELLDQHRSAFPHGAFAQERDVLILEAFQRLHDTASLREGARAFMQRYPRSPHRARVEKLVEDLR